MPPEGCDAEEGGEGRGEEKLTALRASDTPPLPSLALVLFRPLGEPFLNCPCTSNDSTSNHWLSYPLPL